MQYTKRLKSHGVDQKDFKILQQIVDVPKGSSVISEQAIIPRPTVLFRLNALSERRLVKKIGIRPKIKWTLTKTGLEIIEGRYEANSGNKTEGIPNIEARLKLLYKEAENKRLFYLHNTSYLRNADRKLSSQFKEAADVLIIKGKIVQEGVSSMSGGLYYKKRELSKNPKCAHKMTSWVLIDDEYIDEEDSFFVFENKVFLVDLEKEILKEVESQTLSNVVINHIKNLSRLGKKINISNIAR